MSIIFISNEAVQRTKKGVYSNDNPIATKDNAISFNNGNLHFTFKNKPLSISKDETGNTVFVIDVHCTFKGCEKMQEQGGVIIYRHLLKLFENCQDKLKVIFYSPISKDDLVRLRKENYVLKLLPFVQLKFEKDGQFSEELAAVIKGLNDKTGSSVDGQDFSKGWLQFNNASENLLSGWSLAGAKPIDLKGYKVLAIDDQFSEWEVTYNLIFPPSQLLSLKYKSQSEFRDAWRSKESDVLCEIESYLDKTSLVLIDLYLNENHESLSWKTTDYLKDISGYKVFKNIRKKKPAIPVIFHSTSNKIRNYKSLTTLLCDGYVVKDLRIESSNFEKQDTYSEFASSITSAIKDFGHVWLHEQFNFLQEDNSNTWWIKEIKKNYSSDKEHAKNTTQEFANLLKYLLLAYKQLLNHEPELIEQYFAEKAINPYSFSVCNIIQNCGRLGELMGKSNSAELLFLKQLRNQAAHAINYHLYQLNDAKIALVLLFKTLKNGKNELNNIYIFDQPQPRKGNKYKYFHQLFSYVSYYNNFYAFVDSTISDLYEKQLKYYAKQYYKEKWKQYDDNDRNCILSFYSCYYRHYIVINPSISENFQVDIKGGKATIIFKSGKPPPRQ